MSNTQSAATSVAIVMLPEQLPGSQTVRMIDAMSTELVQQSRIASTKLAQHGPVLR